MPRWLRVIRGMIGTGLTFSAGVGVVGSLVAGVAWLLKVRRRSAKGQPVALNGSVS